ncbi:DUF1294 domain-containing protein [Candidatus Sulfurimonas marisnigri]|uniref:DUF1294 domain-containing protein n=1 Tax=Candidatus Sulfurimonas marisnigri TaxID=2740405 RepID=A0A7S7LYW2_9BACT|nr:DUF1294 domain-containing protein [Candidatus Sulfurimonas marisnigri]QOY53825.1 DUF1294 domain-containing protein [Candidatus Sulfurimonas marisnigri]
MIHINFTLSYFEIYLISINIISFTLYAYDKIQALKNIQRVSENKLLFSAFIGGTIGSIISMLIFIHKIKKPLFVIKFSIVAIVQALSIYFYMSKGIHLI